MRYRRWMVDNYSSRRGFVRTIYHQLLFYTGRYQKYKNVDWDRVERLVFVCKGNICRSAYAEAVARSLGCDAISCGVDAIEGAPANNDALEVANSHGLDLSQHKTQPIRSATLKKSDLLVVMEPWQIDYLQSEFDGQYQYSLLGLWVSPILPHLQDPYGAPHMYFDKCFSYIDKSVKAISVKVI